MKKTFLIFGMAACLSLVNGINNANALSDNQPSVTITPVCPDGCQPFITADGGNDDYKCVRIVNGVVKSCGNPTGFIISAINVDDYDIINVPANVNIIKKEKVEKAKQVSARSAETPKLVKKIVYEVVADEE